MRSNIATAQYLSCADREPIGVYSTYAKSPAAHVSLQEKTGMGVLTTHDSPNSQIPPITPSMEGNILRVREAVATDSVFTGKQNWQDFREYGSEKSRGFLLRKRRSFARRLYFTGGDANFLVECGNAGAPDLGTQSAHGEIDGRVPISGRLGSDRRYRREDSLHRRSGWRQIRKETDPLGGI